MIQRTGEVLPLSRPLNNDSYLCIYGPDVLFDGWLHEEDTLSAVNWRATKVNRVCQETDNPFFVTLGLSVSWSVLEEPIALQ